MKRIALSVIAAVSLIAPAFLLPAAASATTCPVKMPETLLALYRGSDAIYIGRYRGSDDGAVTHEDDEYTAVEIKKSFDISSVLKGNPAKSFTLTESDIRYKPKNAGFQTAGQVDQAQAVPQTTDQDVEYLEDLEENVSRELKPGDDAMLFLRNDEEGKRLELTDYRDGIKKLSRSDLALYEARVKDLNSIFTAEKPSPEKITAWLVRCAEDEPTRWEGTYELERSFDALAYKTQRETDRKTKIANGETVEDEDSYFNEDLDTGRTTIFATLLDDYQKQTLTGIFLNSEFAAKPKRPGEPGFVRGDSELMGLVSRWADMRIAGHLVNRLRSGAFTAAENSDMMERITSMIEDQQMTSIAGKFGNVHYEEDSVVVDDEDMADFEEMTAIEPEADPETEGPVDEATPEPADQVEVHPGDTFEQVPQIVIEPGLPALPPANADEAQTAKRSTLTYGQFRDMLIAAFVRRADEVMANPETRVRTQR